MNEKIKQFAEECGLLGGNPHEYQVADYEKFAELIINECAELLLKEARNNHDYGSDTYTLLNNEANWMKTYFGIEDE